MRYKLKIYETRLHRGIYVNDSIYETFTLRAKNFEEAERKAQQLIYDNFDKYVNKNYSLERMV